MKAQNKKLKLINSLDGEQVEEDMEQPNENDQLQETVEQKVKQSIANHFTRNHFNSLQT